MSTTAGPEVEHGETAGIYDELASSYHLLFQDWNRSISRQADVLGPLVERFTGKSSAAVLDCACGIGTQAIGLAQRGHRVVGSDLSRRAVERAKAEAIERGLSIEFCVADMGELPFTDGRFDAVLVGDNALPHLLSQADLEGALRSMAGLRVDRVW